MRSDFSLNCRHAGKIVKFAKPRFELLIVTDGSSRARCTHADEARVKCASIISRRVTMRQSLRITREYWEQHVEEGTFNFPNRRKHRAEDCGKVHSFGVKCNKIMDCSA